MDKLSKFTRAYFNALLNFPDPMPALCLCGMLAAMFGVGMLIGMMF